MPPVVTCKMTGLVELQEKLEKMAPKVAKKILKVALKEGAAPVLQAMQRGAPKHSGFLAEHFGMRFSYRRDEIAGSAFVGPEGKMNYPYRGTGGKRRTITVASVARFLEFGTSKMAANPFMTRAWESSKYTALSRIVNNIRDLVQELAR